MLKGCSVHLLFEGPSWDLLPPLLCLSLSPLRTPHHTPNSRRWTLVLVPLALQPQGSHTEVPWEAHVLAFHMGLPGPLAGTTWFGGALTQVCPLHGRIWMQSEWWPCALPRFWPAKGQPQPHDPLLKPGVTTGTIKFEGSQTPKLPAYVTQGQFLTS